jgi:choline dehydrogenase-like flavoprotein
VFGREDVVRDITLDCDAVVVGSGAGGGVVAAELAEAGVDVIVLEEGGYHPTEEFTAVASDMVPKLYRDHGASMAIGSPVIVYGEGRCVGGSTVINGGMTWRTPERVLDRWASEHDIDGVDARALERIFARVERLVSAAHQDPESIGRDNALLKQGADALGWKVIPNIRNQLHCAGTNNCAFGCPTGAKRSTLVSYVPRALAFGARVYADCRAHTLVTHGKRVVGVAARVVRANGTSGAKVLVRAATVVVAAGSIHTPALLLRSGIRSPSGQLGANLTLHPNAKVVATFDDDVVGWKGVHQAYQVREFQDQGYLMAAVNVPPSILAMGMPFIGRALDEIMAQYNRIVSGGILVEDTTSGRVRVLPGGSPMAFYQLSDRDAERVVRGVALIAELLFAAGARRIWVPFDGAEPLDGPDDVRRLRGQTIPKRAMEIMTTHVMGTCRMGGDRSRHVCDPWGKVYDAEGLWVADASLFPTPIGVNPMETIMALATRNAERIVDTHLARNAA